MTRRNDPCPCGSGKKYKHCCMPREQVISLAKVRYERAYHQLMNDLADYCSEFEGEDLLRAQAQFFGVVLSNIMIDEELSESLQFAFLDWFAFSYQDWETGMTLVSAFKESRSDPNEKELLAGWERSRPGFYLVEQVQSGMALLKDAFTGERFQADLGLEHQPRLDSVILGRLLPTGEIHRPGFDLVEGSVEMLEAVRPLLERELARLRLAFPDASWDDLFRERWPLVRDLVSVAILAKEQGLELTVPKASRRPASLGLVAPPEDVPEGWVAVYDEVLRYTSEMRIPFCDAVAALRLWWDAAAALSPRVVKPEAWAAAVIYVWHHWIHHDDMTQTEVARRFAVSPATVSSRAREIARELAIEEMDDRYADMLDPTVRGHLVLEYLTAAGSR